MRNCGNWQALRKGSIFAAQDAFGKPPLKSRSDPHGMCVKRADDMRASALMSRYWVIFRRNNINNTLDIVAFVLLKVSRQ